MTAPGSVSTPYYGATASDFSFGLPSSSNGLPHDPIFNPAPPSTSAGNMSYPTGSSGAGADSPTYPVVTAAEQRMLEAHLRNSRGLSLPELPGLPASALPDEPHPYAGQFAHMPPPSRYVPPGTTTPLSYSRPTTADSRPATTGSLLSAPALNGEKLYSFVALPGTPKKRPRRRYDEIERMYGCNYPGCTKAYGTLNHLNAHITMQKHGPKRTPQEFKEARKEWRARKKQADESRAQQHKAALASGQMMPGYPLGTFLSVVPRQPTAVMSTSYGDLRPQTAPSSGPFYHHLMDPTPPPTAPGGQVFAFGHGPPSSAHPGMGSLGHGHPAMLPPLGNADGPRRMSLPAVAHAVGFTPNGAPRPGDELRARTSAGPSHAWGLGMSNGMAGMMHGSQPPTPGAGTPTTGTISGAFQHESSPFASIKGETFST